MSPSDDNERVRMLMEVADGSFAVVQARSLYAPLSEAAKIAGVSYETMSAWASDRVSPIPHIRCGRAKKLVRVSAIPLYMQSKESV